jgi:anti-sigma factor RsiW
MVFRFRRRRALVCKEAVELVTHYLEGVLNPDERARFEAHLAECPHCREYLEQIRTTIDVMGHVEPAALEPEARDELVRLYRQWKAR